VGPPPPRPTTDIVGGLDQQLKDHIETRKPAPYAFQMYIRNSMNMFPPDLLSLRKIMITVSNSASRKSQKTLTYLFTAGERFKTPIIGMQVVDKRSILKRDSDDTWVISIENFLNALI
jgi:hypothetical protein